MLNTLIHVRISLAVLDIYAEKQYLTPMFYFISNSGHVLRWINNPKVSSVKDTPMNIHAQFGSYCQRSVREEEF